MLFDEPIKKGKRVSNVKVNKNYQSDLGNSNKPPELVFKVASNIKGNNSSGVIDYITHKEEEQEKDKDKEQEKEFIQPINEKGKALNQEEVEKLKKDWNDEFEQDKRKDSRNMTHFVFSIDVEKNKKNEKSFENAANELLQKRFGEEGFRYIFTQHKDTEHPHIHVVVNNNNIDTKKKLRISPEWHRETRFLAKESLSNHGIEQSATFKKDRDILQKQVKEKEDEFVKCENWFQAKVKQSAKNPEHYKTLLRDWEIATKLKEEIKNSDRFHSQEQIALNNKIKNLRQDLMNYEKFNSRTEANKAIVELIKEVEPPKSLLQKALNKPQELDQKEQKQQDRKLYFHAVEVVNAQKIVETSNAIPSNEKKPILKHIENRLIELEKKGIDVKSIVASKEINQSENKKVIVAFKSLNQVEKKTNKEMKEYGVINQSSIEKPIIRSLNNLNSAKLEATPNEQKILNEKQKTVFTELKNKGVDIDKIVKEWKQAREFKEQVINIKKEISTDINHKDIDKHQKAIFELQERLKTPPKQLDKKELYSIDASLKTSQNTLNQQIGNSYQRTDRQLSALEKNIDNLKQKEPDTAIAKAQAFAIAKKLVINMVENENKFTPLQSNKLNERVKPITEQLLKNGVVLEQVLQKHKLTKQVTTELDKLKGLSMPRIRHIGFDNVEKQITDLSKDNKNTSQTREQKRDNQNHLRDKKTSILTERQNDTEILKSNLEKIKKLSETINERTSPAYTKNLTSFERLNNTRNLESTYKSLGKLVEQSKPLANSPTSKEFKKEVGEVLKQGNKLAHNKSISTGFSR